jgi:hypothetical protein
MTTTMTMTTPETAVPDVTATTPNPPPQLSHYVANGYNARDGNFLGVPVFTLSYAQGNTVYWNSVNRDVPDQISASLNTQYFQGTQTQLMETKADYDRSYSVTVGAEYAGVTYSGSASSSLLYRGNLFTSTSSTYGLNYYVQCLLSFERLDHTLDAGFATALKNLPAPIDTPDAQQQYIDFFNTYGTHYLETGTMGGSIIMETDVRDDLIESTSALEVSTAITAGYQGAVASGTLSVAAAYSNSAFLNEHRNQIQITIAAMGGLYSDQISVWQPSVYDAPTLLLNVPGLGGSIPSNLACISKLVVRADAAAAIATNIEQMLHTYMTPLYVDDGLLASPEPVKPAVVVKKDADGFLLATLRGVNNGDCSTASGYDDENGNPQTVRARASMHLYNDNYVLSGSFLMPAPQGCSFLGATDGQPLANLQFMEMGNVGQRGLQSWGDVALNTPTVAAQDGFVVAWADWNNVDGSRGTIVGAQSLSPGGSMTPIAGSSLHVQRNESLFVTGNSFTMPVRKGASYQVTTNSGTDSNAQSKPLFGAAFLPLDGSVQFGDLTARNPGRTYQAQSDGFLMAYLSYSNDGDRGSVDLYSYPDENDLLNLGQLATTSIHFYSQGNCYVGCNTATIPVQRGNSYTVNLTPTWGNPTLSLYWVPLTKA